MWGGRFLRGFSTSPNRKRRKSTGPTLLKSRGLIPPPNQFLFSRQHQRRQPLRLRTPTPDRQNGPYYVWLSFLILLLWSCVHHEILQIVVDLSLERSASLSQEWQHRPGSIFPMGLPPSSRPHGLQTERRFKGCWG